jgi:organic hydroperoxide reductase OsmC/OhrA
MSSQHIFKVETNWTQQAGETTTKSRGYSRNHSVRIEGKLTDLKVSAAKVFKGDAALHNPEDLLLSALSSCHMMSFFYLCSLHHIDVVSYQDHAEGILEVNSIGKGQFILVKLNPVVIVSQPEMLEKAKTLHTEANNLCFIANSCNFPITHHAEVKVYNL